jgi:AcrR family transcriptional regulator
MPNVAKTRTTSPPPSAPVESAAPAMPAIESDESWDLMMQEISHRPKRGTERKQDRSKRTEQQILNAALRVFARDGISRSRIADIAAEAGISTSTLYEYYKSKEDLAYDVPMSHLAEFFEAYHQAAQTRGTAREKLALYLTMSADYAREHAEWARLLYLEIWPSVFVSETELSHSINDFVRVIVFLLREGVTEGWLSPNRNPYETASLVMGGINQTIITWLVYRKPRNLTKAGAEMAERLLSLLELEAKAG